MLDRGFMPWLCVDHMIQQGVWPMGFIDPPGMLRLKKSLQLIAGRNIKTN